MAGTPPLSSVLVFAVLSLLVLYHGLGHIKEVTRYGMTIEAAEQACPMPAGAVQHSRPRWQRLHAAFLQELQAAQDAGVRCLVAERP